MPIHEYRCKQCGQVHDHLVGVTADETALACPDCGSPDLSRLLSSFAVNLNGRSGAAAGDCGACDSAPLAGGHCCGGGCCHG